MRVGSLFSGVGGLDLGLERAGMEVIFQVESDPYCQKVLKKHWPEVTLYGDIEEINWEEVERPDLVCGGFPCQPVSVAGKQLRQEDDRWLWPEFRRCLRGVRPRYVLVENVPGLLSGGMGDVLGDLAALGYDAEWESLPAAAFGAPHLRYRVFIVAVAATERRTGRPDHQGQASTKRDRIEEGGNASHTIGNRLERGEQAGKETRPARRGGEVADSENHRRQGTGSAAQQETPAADKHGEEVRHPEILTLGAGLRSTGQGGIGRGRLGDSDGWLTEPDVGRVAHGVPARVDRLRALGNAVVPQCAEWIGRRILSPEDS